MFVQKYFCNKEMKGTLLNAIDVINEEVGRTVLRYGCGIYREGTPQDITVTGENYETIEYLNNKIWG